MKKKRIMRFYSKEEIKALQPFISGEQKVNPANLEEFCKTYKRNFAGASVYIYTHRRKANKKSAVKPSRVVKTNLSKKVNKLTASEFVVKILHWELKSEGGSNYLVFKY